MNLTTAIGDFYLDGSPTGGCGVGVSSVETVDNLGPNSTYAWSEDQEEAIRAAAAEAGAALELMVPGGWRVTPAATFAKFTEALARIANSMRPTSRRTPPR